MRALRLGSYSMEWTFAGIPTLSRRKSMIRYLRGCPPPLCRTLMRPLLSRPPVRDMVRVRDFSGRTPFVMSSKESPVRKRRPGEVGLYFLIAMVLGDLGKGSSDEGVG